jgi:hypothetical protein
MRLEAKKYVFDIQRAAALIAEFTSGLSLEEYQRRPMVPAAVEREFEIIGEALTRLMKRNEKGQIVFARLGHFASVMVVASGLLACSREAPPPVAREAQPQSAVAATPAVPQHSGAAGADHGSWATAGDSVPESLREPCANVNSLVRSVVDAAPPSTKITEVMGPRAVTFNYLYAKAHAAGCEFVTRGSDRDSSSGLFEAMEKAFDGAGWMSMDATYAADGPDGSDLGYSRDGLLCVIEGRWDGGDDSDPKVIPGPEFDVFVTCAPRRGDDHPPS